MSDDSEQRAAGEVVHDGADREVERLRSHMEHLAEAY